MTRTVNSLKSVERETSELLMIVGTPDEPTREQQEFYCGLDTYRTRPVLPDQQKQVSSFVSQTLKTHMGWHEHL